MCKVLSERLLEIAFDPRYERRELARAAHISESKLSRVLSEDSSITAAEAQRLAWWLLDRGDKRLAECFLTTEYRVLAALPATSNGAIDDEICDLQQQVGHYIDAVRSGASSRALEACDTVEAVLARMRAEARRL